MTIKVGVLPFLGVGQSATDRFRYDPLVSGLRTLGYASEYVDPCRSDYDVIVVPLKKRPNPFPRIKQQGRVIIGDLTDDMLSFPFTFYSSVGRYTQIFKKIYRHHYYRHLLQQCDWVVAGSAGQAESFRRVVRGVSVVTDAIPTADTRYGTQYINQTPCRLIWFGNVQSLYGLVGIQEVLDELASTGAYELHLITSNEIKYGLAGRRPRNGPEFMARQQIPCNFHPWSLATCACDLAEGDIAVVPVEPGSNYNRRKPAGRVLLAMALGLPVVASAIPAYEEVIEQSKTGYIARSGHEWTTFIRQLADNSAHRKTIGLAARHFALNNYSEKKFAQRYRAVIERVVAEFKSNF
jgi:hypothetical protein